MQVSSQQVIGRQQVIAILLIAAAMLLGGGGSPAPVPEMLLQVICAMLIAALLVAAPVPAARVPRPAWIIAGLLIVLPALQLVPLPPAIWHALPAREGERAALALVGAQDSWRPWSVSPARTLASLLALGPPVASLLLTASLARAGRNMVMGVIAGCGLLALLIGTLQISGGEANPARFYVPDAPYLNGFQANHNSAADVLLIAMVAFAGALREWSERRPGRLSAGVTLGVLGGGAILFSLGVFLTASRAGTALLPVAWLAVVAIAWPWLRFSRKTLIAIGVCVVAAALGLLMLFEMNGVIARVLSRYNFEGEFRPQLWRDALYAAQQYLPFGAGVGTFVPVFIAAERLEVVDPSLPNRAHNELLEVAMETGVVGLIAVSIGLFLLSRLLMAGLRRPPAESRAQVYFAAATFSIVALHSQVDYPLRSMSLACIAAAAAGLLMPAARQRPSA